MRLAMRGPFAYVRRRTVVPQATRGGLKERGRRLGGYLEAWEIAWPRIIAELERLQCEDRGALILRARGYHHFTAAIRALDRRDDARFRAELDQACRLVPELTERPLRITNRFKRWLSGWDESAERLRLYRTAAALWPDQRADTALYLRACAAVLALRTGRPAEAARLARGWPLRATPSLLIRLCPDLVRRCRKMLVDYRHPGRESQKLAEEG
jgi:hypothetical protein